MAKRKKSYRRRARTSSRRRGGSRKQTAMKLIKGVAYGAAVVVPGYTVYKASGGGGKGIADAAGSYAGMNRDTGQFDLATLTYMWAPVATVAVVDFVTTKLPIQRTIARGLRNIF